MANNKLRADSVLRLLRLLMGLGVIRLICYGMQWHLLRDPEFSMESAEANDERMRTVLGFYSFSLLIMAIIFGRWIVQAHRAVRALGAEGMTIGPGWAVGYFFIPILNFFRPYQAMQELWKASVEPRAWASQSDSKLVAVWWGLMIGCNIVGKITGLFMNKAGTAGELRVLTAVYACLGVVALFLAFVAFRMVQKITDQINHHQRLAAVEATVLPGDVVAS